MKSWKVHEYRYTTEAGEAFSDAYSFKSCWDEDDGDCIAEDAAKDYHDEHDGWEATWDDGIEFTIWTDAGKLIGTWTVHRDYEPVFAADQKPATLTAPGADDGK